VAYEERDMTGTLWREREKKSEKHPDYTGTLLIDGTRWRLAGWIKDGAKGKFLSLAVSLPLPRDEQPRAKKPDDDGELPW
jgi:hypothetical protein